MASHSAWSDLPNDILELIFNCAKDPIDIIRRGAACKSWLPTALQVHRKFLRLCFIPAGEGLAITRPLFNILTEETRMIQFHEDKGKCICSVSNCWLFTLDIKFPYRMQLLNGLSGTQIDLPPNKYSIKFLLKGIRPLHCKLLLSKCPLDSDCTLFLLQYSLKRPCTISSWKPGQKKGSNLITEFKEIRDAILYKEKLYATVIDSTTHRHLLVTYIYQLEVEANFSIPKTNGCYHLVKSHNIGCLLLIEDNRWDESFNILEFDPCTKQFREVNDLGSFAFFLSCSGHLCSKAGNLES